MSIQTHPETRSAESSLVPEAPAVETTANRRVATQLVQRLQRAGIDRVFGIPGGTVGPVFDALEESPVELIVCQHEAMAVYSAVGYARVTRRPGVVLVTSGPGVLNTVTGLASALRDEAPLLVIAGEIATQERGRGALQDGSDGGLKIGAALSHFVKLSTSILRTNHVEPVLSEALSVAQSFPQGPVLITVPVDVSRSSSRESRAIVGRCQVPTMSVPIAREIAGLLETAKRPLILAGGGVHRARAARELVELAEWMRCPVATDIEAKGVFPEDHPLSLGIFGAGGSGRSHEYVGAGPDLTLVIGARLDDPMTAGFSPLVATNGHLIQLDHNASRLSRAYDTSLAVHCELASSLALLQAQVAPPKASTLMARDSNIPVRESSHPDGEARAPFQPGAALRRFQSALPKNTVFTSDIGNHLLFAGTHLCLNNPGQFHVSMGMGGMTSGLGMAIGMQAAFGRSRRVVAICGDGGLLMGGNELATCAHYGVPLTVLVLNDGRLGMVDDGQRQIFGRSPGFSVPAVDLVKYAESLGARAYRIDSLSDLDSFEDWDRSLPTLIDLPIDPAARAPNPRFDALSKNGKA